MLRAIAEQADARDRPDGSHARSRHPRGRVHAFGRGRRRLHGEARLRARRARRCAPGRATSTTRRAFRIDRLRAELAAQTKRALVQPVFFGSAITGAGVESLTSGIAELLPAARRRRRGLRLGHRLQDRAGAGGREDRLRPHVLGHGAHARPAPVRRGRRAQGDRDQRLRPRRQRSIAPSVSAGEIGKLWGLGRDPDRRRDRQRRARRAEHHFAPPTLETVVVPTRARTTTARCASRSPSSPSRTR